MLGKVSLEKIENAFLPAREIVEPERFAGRQKQIEQCYLGLLSDGTNIALFGNRGVGKSSLARQLVLLASGKVELLRRYAINFDRELDYLALSFTCGDSVDKVEDLLDKLLNSNNCLSPWVYDTPQAKKIIDAISPKLGANFLGVGLEFGGTKSTEVASVRAAPLPDVVSVFTNVLSVLVKEIPSRDGILIVIDEFDQIKDKKGFASFLKSLATNVPRVRFAIVGVAHDLYDLIKEHQSADRLFAAGVVHVPAMNHDELKEIIDIAEGYISQKITFDVGARDRLIALAQGHPYMVHLLGKHALRAANKHNKSIINLNDIDVTLKEIAESGADPVLEGRYKKSIQSSPQRESVLRALASAEKDGEVWTSDAYPIATTEGVENPSQYVGNLVTEDYGTEIVKVRDRYYRFKDSLFRAYVCARPRQYTSEEVAS